MTLEQIRTWYIILGMIGMPIGLALLTLSWQTIIMSRRHIERMIAILFFMKDLGIMGLLLGNSVLAFWLLRQGAGKTLLPAYVQFFTMIMFDLFLIGTLWLTTAMRKEREGFEKNGGGKS